MRLSNLSLILLGLLFTEGALGKNGFDWMFGNKGKSKTDYEYDDYGYEDYNGDKKTPAPTPKPTPQPRPKPAPNSKQPPQILMDGKPASKEQLYKFATTMTGTKQIIELNGKRMNGQQFKAYLDSIYSGKPQSTKPKPLSNRGFMINGKLATREQLYAIAQKAIATGSKLDIGGQEISGQQFKDHLDKNYVFEKGDNSSPTARPPSPSGLLVGGKPATKKQLYDIAEQLIRNGKQIKLDGTLLSGPQFKAYLDKRYQSKPNSAPKSARTREVLRRTRNIFKKAYEEVKGTNNFANVTGQKLSAAMLLQMINSSIFRDVIVVEIFEKSGAAGVLKYEKKDAILYDVDRFYTCVRKSDAKAKYDKEVDLPDDAFTTLASTNFTALNDDDAGVPDDMTCELYIKLVVKEIYPDGATDIEKEVFSQLFKSITMGTEKGVLDAVYKYHSMFGTVDVDGVKKRLPCQCADPNN